VVTDSSVHNGKKDQTCSGGLQSYCCAGFKPPPTLNQIAGKAADAAKDAAEAAAEQAALDVAAKAFCRVAVPALLAPLELAEDLIPIIGLVHSEPQSVRQRIELLLILCQRDLRHC
jgi:chitinase